MYPEQNVASVNYLQIPEGTPINFQITSDAPMNSFWIPGLGGQVYAMAGMSTQLHLIADKTGLYRGSSANLSGKGFSGMNFMARSSSQADFNDWIAKLRQYSKPLTNNEYTKLAKPSEKNSPEFFTIDSSNTYINVLAKYTGASDSMMGMQAK